MTSVHFQGKPFNITVIQVYAPTTNAKEAEIEQFYEDLKDLLELTQKEMSFPSQGTGMGKQEVKTYVEQQASFALEYKMKQAKTNRILPREHTYHSKHSFSRTQEMTLHMDGTK